MRNDRLRMHSFYADLLYSIRYLFDNIVFEPGYIKQYEFNIGSRTFQLEYETQYAMPSALINYQESNPNLYHSWLLLRNDHKNQSKFPVLFNNTKDLTLELQEEEYQVSVEVIINCESQYSAIELEHRIKSRTPLNKLLQIYNFYTFLELPDEILNPSMFDINNDEIFNLYQKYDYISDHVVNCCAVRYEPLVRLESCSCSIGTSEPRSFSVNCNYTFTTGVPIYYNIPFSERPRFRFSDILKEKKAITIIDKDQLILQGNFISSDDKLSKEYIPIFPDDDHNFSENFKIDDIYEYEVSGKITNYYYYGECDIILEKDSKIEEFKNNFQLTINTKTNKKSLILKGILTGELFDFVICEYKFTGLFKGRFNSIEIDQKITIHNYTIIENSFSIKEDVKIKKVNDFNISHKYTFTPIVNGDIHSTMTYINSRILEFIPDESEVVGVIFKEHETSKIHIIYENVRIDKYGNFIIPISYINKNNNKTFASIRGKLNRVTMAINTEIIKEQYDADFDVIAVLFNFQFKSSPKYGARYIHGINLNIYPDYIGQSPIALGTKPVSFMKNQFNTSVSHSNLKNIRNYILSPLLNDDNVFKYDAETDQIIITIHIDDYLEFYQMHTHERLYWKFTFENNVIDSEGELIQLILDDSNINPRILKFKCDKELYQNSLRYYTVSNPIFFQIYEQLKDR